MHSESYNKSEMKKKKLRQWTMLQNSCYNKKFLHVFLYTAIIFKYNIETFHTCDCTTYLLIYLIFMWLYSCSIIINNGQSL